jgi:hypothetical protein
VCLPKIQKYDKSAIIAPAAADDFVTGFSIPIENVCTRDFIGFTGQSQVEASGI